MKFSLLRWCRSAGICILFFFFLLSDVSTHSSWRHQLACVSASDRARTNYAFNLKSPYLIFFLSLFGNKWLWWIIGSFSSLLFCCHLFRFVYKLSFLYFTHFPFRPQFCVFTTLKCLWNNEFNLRNMIALVGFKQPNKHKWIEECSSSLYFLLLISCLTLFYHIVEFTMDQNLKIFSPYSQILFKYK